MTSTTKERPILFSGPMVRAILEGKKTVTRRPVKPQYESDAFTARPATDPRYERHSHDWWLPTGTQPYAALPRCPFGKPGDQLWVREAWRTVAGADEIPPRNLMNVESFTHYEADGVTAGMGKLRPSMFMPRWASRLQLEISGVRVERLQDITDDQARAEGVEVWARDADPVLSQEYADDPKLAFVGLWTAVNGLGSYNANPWVWVVEFKRVTP